MDQVQAAAIAEAFSFLLMDWIADRIGGIMSDTEDVIEPIRRLEAIRELASSRILTVRTVTGLTNPSSLPATANM